MVHGGGEQQLASAKPRSCLEQHLAFAEILAARTDMPPGFGLVR